MDIFFPPNSTCKEFRIPQGLYVLPSDMISQPVSTTMVETSNFYSSSMFVTSPEAHLYCGTSIPPDYHSLSGTFSGIASSAWTSPMSYILRITYRTYLMNVTQPAPSPQPTPTIEQMVGPYVIRQGYLQQPKSPYVGCPPSGV